MARGVSSAMRVRRSRLGANAADSVWAARGLGRFARHQAAHRRARVPYSGWSDCVPRGERVHAPCVFRACGPVELRLWWGSATILARRGSSEGPTMALHSPEMEGREKDPRNLVARGHQREEIMQVVRIELL